MCSRINNPATHIGCMCCLASPSNSWALPCHLLNPHVLIRCHTSFAGTRRPIVMVPLEPQQGLPATSILSRQPTGSEQGPPSSSTGIVIAKKQASKTVCSLVCIHDMQASVEWDCFCHNNYQHHPHRARLITGHMSALISPAPLGLFSKLSWLLLLQVSMMPAVRAAAAEAAKQLPAYRPANALHALSPLTISTPAASVDVEVEASAVGIRERPSDRDFSWANDSYSELQRTLDTWSFFSVFRVRLWVEDCGWTQGDIYI